MKIILLNLGTTIVAGIITMILHELPKSIVYNRCNKTQNKKTKRNIFKIVHYIDPIGLILCAVSYSGFSKPYMYRIKEKQTNFLLGLTGFLSLFTIFLVSIGGFLVLYGNGADITYMTEVQLIQALLLQNLYVISINMLIVNLFPVSTFDMGLLIAGRSPGRYFSIIRNDYLIKILLIFSILFGIIPRFGGLISNLFLA